MIMIVVLRRQQRPDMKHSRVPRLGSIHHMTEVFPTRRIMGRSRPSIGDTALKARTMAIVRTLEIQGARKRGKVFRVCRIDVESNMDWVVMWFSSL